MLPTITVNSRCLPHHMQHSLLGAPTNQYLASPPAAPALPQTPASGHSPPRNKPEPSSHTHPSTAAMNRLPMPLAYACARFANGCLLQLQTTVDRVAARPVEHVRRPVRRHPASSHISMRSADVQHAARCMPAEPLLQVS